MSEMPAAESPLAASAHPVTRVFCDDLGLICYERDGASPIHLNTVSPDRSRREARRRCRALIDQTSHGAPIASVDLSAIEFLIPISVTGKGLNCRQLAEQTFMAIERSKIVEAERTVEFNAKRKKYGV